MKPNIFMMTISLCVSVLAGYGLYAANQAAANAFLISILGGITFFCTLIGCIGFKYSRLGHAVNIRIVSLLFCFLFLIDNSAFTILGIHVAPYVVITGGLLLLYIGIVYSITQTKI